jgi:hypothetical protein
VTGLAVLALLLVASYLGGFLVGGDRARGLATGAGVVMLGFLSGPSMLGLVSSDTLELFTPLTQVGVGWLAMDAGKVYGRVLGRPVRPGRGLWGVGVALFTGVVVAAVAMGALRGVPRLASELDGEKRWVLVLGLSAALCETTRSVCRWAWERWRARGPLFNRLLDLSAADDIIPIVVLSVAVALEPISSVFGPLPWPVGAAAQLVCGWMLGAAAAVMLGRSFRINVFRGVTVGVTLVAVGFAVRLGLSLVAVAFGLGLGMASVSRHRARIRRVAASERFVLLPILFLAGAMTSIDGVVPWLAGAAVAARLLAKVVAGFGLWAAWPEARSAGPLFGASLSSSGALSICVGLSFALRFPGLVGDAVLTAATLSIVIGEFIGPTSLRRALRKAGELDETPVEKALVTAVQATP